MSTFDLSKLTPQQVGELVSAMNADGVLHAISGSTLTVSEDDESAIATVLALMEQEAKRPSLVSPANQSGDIRYDISELHAVEIQFLKTALDSAGVAYKSDSRTLTASRAYESKIDDFLDQAAEYVKSLEMNQEKARRVSAGLDSPSCEICGNTPAAPIDLRRQVGMVVIMKTYTAEMTLCSGCADEAYRQFQKSTALKGWTGVRSALMNPIVLGTNAVNRNKHRKNLKGKG